MTITKQEVFDRALSHLRKQGEPAIFVDEMPRCRYRTPEGLKCAIGALISDENYYLDLEGWPASAKRVYELFEGTQQDAEFYADIQAELHDDIYRYLDFPGRLEIAAESFANRYKLEYKPC